MSLKLPGRILIRSRGSSIYSYLPNHLVPEDREATLMRNVREALRQALLDSRARGQDGRMTLKLPFRSGRPQRPFGVAVIQHLVVQLGLWQESLHSLYEVTQLNAKVCF